jgi:Flp pilus assembly protein TadG
MMQCARLQNKKRRGAVAVLTAILMVVLLGMVAFAVDVGWMSLSQSELQNAADSAALAGAGQLMSPAVQFSLPQNTAANQASILSAAETSAKTYAKNFASYNRAGGVSSLVLLDSDIEFGLTDSSGNYTKYTGNPTYANSFPNTIKVTLRLDGTSGGNGPLGLFFGSVLGTSNVNLTATASATIYAGTVDNFSSTPNAGLLPMTMDVNAWNTFLATGQSSDGAIHTDANGLPQMQLYPSPNLAPGNFGMLSLDDSSNDSSSISGWINNGLSASDLATLQTYKLLPLSTHDNTQWDWKGAPGFKASDLNQLTVGQTFLLPLFNPVVATTGSSYQATDKSAGSATPGDGGVGQNAYYQIVKFVGIKITQLDKSSDLYVQPAYVMDPAAIMSTSSIKPMTPGSSASLVTTFTTPKLTQ